MLGNETIRLRPYERQALKTLEKVARRKKIWNVESPPFSSFQDIADYFHSKYGLQLVLGVLCLPEDNFLVAFKNYSVSKLVTTIRRQGLELEEEDNFAVVFPWKSGIFVISTWDLGGEYRLPRLILPERKLVVYFWEDFLETLF